MYDDLWFKEKSFTYKRVEPSMTTFSTGADGGGVGIALLRVGTGCSTTVPSSLWVLESWRPAGPHSEAGRDDDAHINEAALASRARSQPELRMGASPQTPAAWSHRPDPAASRTSACGAAGTLGRAPVY